MKDEKTITKMVLKLILQAALVVLTVVIVVFDAGLSEQGKSELSWTELAHEICILSSAILFGISAKYEMPARGFFILVMGLFTTMLIRESDALFDNIQHGFWIYPALAVTLAAIFYARKYTGTVKKPLLNYMDSASFAYINVGLIIILVFSRTFGSGFLWRDVMGADYSIVYKSVIQEGLELLGYMFVLYGSIMIAAEVFKKKQQGR